MQAAFNTDTGIRGLFLGYYPGYCHNNIINIINILFNIISI